MKTVFSSVSDCIHAYAQRPNDPTTHGRSGSVFFEDGKLYSYGRHYVLAEWIDGNTVLIDDRGYSVTTAKHISKTRSALSQYRQFMRNSVEPLRIASQLNQLRQALIKARKPEIYIAEAKALLSRHFEYLHYIDGTPAPVLFDHIQFFTGIDTTVYAERIEQEKQKQAERQAENALRYREAFNTYEPYGIFRAAAGADYDLIRFKQDDPTTVETSQNVKTPYSVALEAFKRFKRSELNKGQHVAGFTVHEIEPEYIRIGCHRFLITDLETFFGVPTV